MTRLAVVPALAVSYVAGWLEGYVRGVMWATGLSFVECFSYLGAKAGGMLWVMRANARRLVEATVPWVEEND